MKIPKLLFFAKFHCASDDIFVIKIELSMGENDNNLDKKVIQYDFLQFLEYSAYSSTQCTTTSICHPHIPKFSDKSHK